ncbi:MAG: MmcQ/YjbR family DNA-binding protein [Bacteroidales bacterium]|nr:MmcQ/YjbR family DNA-binding protein [Bacteroidales bacterium]MCF8387637.1 MmcQ/YjbR family DNA-binding protein [Bacteroidales bacterium]MCF8397945.1 MmcQ/YjbR family DNA-binding protein [Bacteroidales bacterium]
MNIEQIREYCLSKKSVTEGFPFDNDTLVFKVANKMFALLSLEKKRINLKCDPQRAIELREHYDFIIPGYHMNKQQWNTISFEAGIDGGFLMEMIDHSYDLIVASLPKKVQAELSSD